MSFWPTQLALVDGPARDEHLIGSLWRQRLALRCVAALGRLQGPGEDEATLRDHLYLTRPGHDPGPAGRLLTEATSTDVVAYARAAA